MVCYGLLWFVMVCYGLLWFVMVCNGLLWFVMVCYGFVSGENGNFAFGFIRFNFS